MFKFQKFLRQPSWQFFNIPIWSYVIKIPKSRWQILDAINKSRWKHKDISYKRKLVNETISRRKMSVVLFGQGRSLKDLCQIICILPFGIIVQRRGKSFLELLHGNHFSIEELAVKYGEICIEIWKSGVFESCFDFLRNSGMLNNGTLFHIDIGDFHDDLDFALKALDPYPWQKRVDYLSLSQPDRDSIDNILTNYINRKNLVYHWRFYENSGRC